MHQQKGKRYKARGFLFSAFFCACIFFGGLYTCIAYVTYDDAFYAAQYRDNYTDYATGISHDELARVTDEMQLFLSGKRADFDIWANVAGTYRAVFNEQEQFHMAEVRQLYLAFGVVRNIAAALLCAALALSAALKLRGVFRALANGALAAFILTALIGVGSVVAFDPMFTLFHKLFFNNDLWLFDPRTSILIQMLPIEFFMAAALRIFVAFAILCAVLCLTGVVLHKVTERRLNGQRYQNTRN